MADGVLVWAKRQKEDMERVIPLYENGTVQMTEMRAGERVNVTAEYLARVRKNLAELNELVTRHDG